MENTNNGTVIEGGNPAETQKKGLLTRIYDGYQKVKIKMRSTKGGRAVIKITKGTAIGLGLYGTYKLGQKSVKPTTVYIESGVEESEEEPETEEVNEEVTEE